MIENDPNLDDSEKARRRQVGLTLVLIKYFFPSGYTALLYGFAEFCILIGD